MLRKLTVKNVALIDGAEIDFTTGLNVLSGETGAGKSVIMESLNFVLGAKADKSFIRNGETEATVCAFFDTADCNGVNAVLSDLGIDNDGELLIQRRLNDSGKNTVKINGEPATVSMLKRLAGVLIDVHGQSEHFLLLNRRNQLKLLDSYCGEELSDVVSRLKGVYSEYKSLKDQRNAMGGDESQRLIRMDVLSYQIKEIENAAVYENEQEELNALKDKLVNQERILTALNGLVSAVSDDGGVSDVLSGVSREISRITAFGEDYSALADRLEGAYSEICDIESTARALTEDFETGERSLEEVEERLKTAKDVLKKDGGDYNSVTEFYQNAKVELEKLENFNENTQKLDDLILDYQKKLYAGYLELNGIRRKNARIFSERVLTELKELSMEKARFEIRFNDLPDIQNASFNGAEGIDDVEFTFSANLGEPLKPLSEVISGGELSRFMLSVKAQSSKFNDIPTFLFDEIDAGISGVVARVVAEKLCDISRSVQVIAVSHLPQIASFADNNILISKTEEKEKTYTRVKTLDKKERVLEIVRLLGGDGLESSAITHAQNLIDKAEEYKKSL